MKIKKDQIWKRQGEDRWYQITKKEDGEFFLQQIAGGLQLGDLWRNKERLQQVYEHIYPVVCLDCDTSRARFKNAKRYAKGLLCWSCVDED